MKANLTSLDAIPELQSAVMRAAICFGNDAPMPPVIATLPPSVEIEPVMDNLCDDMEKASLVRFTGDKRWMNVLMRYEDPPKFSSFTHMLGCLRQFAGCRNRFGGIVRMDMTQWLEHMDDQRVSDVLAYIHDYSDEIFFIISVTVKDPHLAHPLIVECNRWMYTIAANVAGPTADLLLKTIKDKLTTAGHSLTPDAVRLLSRSLEILAEQEDFAGLRELNALAVAIACDTVNIKKISAEHLADYAPDGEWMSRRTGAGNKITTGFSGGAANERQ